MTARDDLIQELIDIGGEHVATAAGGYIDALVAEAAARGARNGYDAAYEEGYNNGYEEAYEEGRAEGAAEVRAQVTNMIPGSRMPYFDTEGNYLGECLLIADLTAALAAGGQTKENDR